MQKAWLVLLSICLSTHPGLAETIDGHVFISGKEFVTLYEREKKTARMLITGLLGMSNFYSMLYKKHYKRLPMICLAKETLSGHEIIKATDHLYRTFKANPETQTANAPLIAAIEFTELFPCR